MNITVFETIGIVLVVFFRPAIKNTDQYRAHRTILNIGHFKPLRYLFEVFSEHGQNGISVHVIPFA